MTRNEYLEYVYTMYTLGAFLEEVEIKSDGQKLTITTDSDAMAPIIIKPLGLTVMMEAPDYPALFIHGPYKTSIALRIKHDMTPHVKKGLLKLTSLMSAREL